MRDKIIKILLVTFLILLSQSSIEPVHGASRLQDHPKYLIDRWQLEDGLPKSTILSISQKDGYIWLSTEMGLVRFDGASFSLFDQQNLRNLRRSTLGALHTDRKSRLWLCDSFAMVFYLENGNIVPAKDLHTVTGPVQGFSETSDGSLWIKMGGGLFCLKNDKWIKCPLPEKPYLPAAQSWTGRPGEPFWTIVEGRLYGLNYKNPAELPQLITGPEVHCINYSVQDEGIWILNQTGIQLWRKDGSLDQPIPIPWKGEVWSGQIVRGLADELLVGSSSDGLWRVYRDKAGAWTTEQIALAGSRVVYIFKDSEQSIWVASDGSGLLRLRLRRFVSIRSPDLTGIQTVHSVTPASDGGVWVGMAPGGVFRLTDDSGKWNFEPHSSIPNHYPWSLFEDSKRRLWVGNFHGPVYSYDLSSGESQLHDLKTSSPSALAILEAPLNNLWFCGVYGLVHLRDGNINAYDHTDGLAHPHSMSVARTLDGALWIGTVKGLSRFQNNRFENFDQRHGLPQELISALHTDAEGTLWIGTYGGGLACKLKENDHFSTFDSRTGLSIRNIVGIISDNHGHLWMSTDQGVVQANRSDLKRVAEGNASPVQSWLYDESDGLPTRECSWQTQPSLCQTSDGRLWFSTVDGLAMAEPQSFVVNKTPPKVVIEQVRRNGAVIWSSIWSEIVDGSLKEAALHPKSAPPKIIEAAPGPSQLEIQYSALSFTSPHRIRFKYRMEGLDIDWVDAGSRRVAYYTRPKPGRYKFQVIACNADQIWNETGATFEVEIQPFFWETNSFLAGCLIFVGIASSVAARRVVLARTRRRIEKLEQQNVLFRERARIAKDMHDHLGADLTHITLMTEMLERRLPPDQQDGKQARQISGTVRELVQSIDEIVWATNPEKDTLRNTIAYLVQSAEKFFEDNDMALRLDYPSNVPELSLRSEVRHNLFLAVREGLNNAMKHSCAAEVHLIIELREQMLLIIVRDNGIGFSTEQAEKGRSGLKNMVQRMTAVGGSCQWATKPQDGVVLEFRLPLEAGKANQ